MPADRFDLTGTWHGTYTYPASEGPATPFLATIDESGGAFTGTIIEIDAFYRQGTISAGISGHRAGVSVDFVKSYSGGIIGYETPVDYVGRLSGDGLLITGVWSLVELDGTFEMERDASIQEEVAIEETVSVGR